MSENLPIVKTSKSLVELFEKNQKLLSKVMSDCKYMDAQKMFAFFLSAARKDPKILGCTVESVMECMMKSAQIGLEINTPNHHACVIPYKNELTFMTEYRGMIELIMRSGKIGKVEADVVYLDDEFEYKLLPETYIHHIPNFKAKRTDDKIIGAWLKVWFKDRNIEPFIRFVHIDEINKHRACAQTQKIWDAWFPQMCMKTTVRIHGRWLPQTPELQRALEIEDQSLPVNFNDITEFVDVTSIEGKRVMESKPPKLEKSGKVDDRMMTAKEISDLDAMAEKRGKLIAMHSYIEDTYFCDISNLTSKQGQEVFDDFLSNFPEINKPKEEKLPL